MAKIYRLLICRMCRKRIEEDDSYHFWEQNVFCEDCFNALMDSIELSDFSTDDTDK